MDYVKLCTFAAVQHSEGVSIFQAARVIRRLVTEQDIQRKTVDRSDSSNGDHIEYGLGKCSLIPRFFPRNISEWKNRK